MEAVIGLLALAACAYGINRVQLETLQAQENPTSVVAHSFYSQLTGVPDNQEELN